MLRPTLPVVRRRVRRLFRGLRLEALESRNLLATYTTLEDTPLVVSDPNLAALVVVKQAEHGTVAPTNVGGFVYSPAPNYHGADRFVYVLATGTTASNTPGTAVEVAIQVEAVNDAPAASADEYSGYRNSQLSIEAPGVLKNDKDIDSEKLTVKVVAQTAHGQLTLNENGGFKYTPAEAFVGDDSFTYRASDGQAQSAETKVVIHVRPLPDARDDQYSVAQNTVFTVQPKGVLANDLGVNGRSLVASLEPGDQNAPQHGKVELNVNGGFTYKPDDNYVGSDSFVYRATDSTPALDPAPGSSTTSPLPAAYDLARVYLYVYASPVVRANPDSYTTLVNTALGVAAPGVLKNDYVLYVAPTAAASGTNTAGQPPLTATLLAKPVHGTVELATDGSFQYVPVADFTGTDTFTYQAKLATTAGTPAAGGSASPSNEHPDITTVTIQVKPPPLPVALNDYYRVLEDSTLSVTTPGVLTNDRPVENHQLTARLDDNVDHGELTLNSDGSFKYVPKPGFAGYDTFTYFALDANAAPPTSAASGTLITTADNNNPVLPPRPSNLATVTIYVQDANPPVYAYDDFYQMVMNGELGIGTPGVLKNDSLQPPYVILQPTAAGAAGQASSANDPTDPLKITISARLLTEPANGQVSFNPDGSFKYDPKEGFVGTDTFTYQALASVGGTTVPPASTSAANSVTGDVLPCTNTLAGASVCPPVPLPDDIATVTIYVKQPEPPPGPVAQDDYFVAAANTVLAIRAPGVLGNDYVRGPLPVPPANTNPQDPNSPPVPYRPLAAVLVDKPAHGKLTLNENGSFEYVAEPGYAGDDKFTYQARLLVTTSTGSQTAATAADILPPTLSNIATVTIHVAPAIAKSDAYSTLQDTPLEVGQPGVLGNDLGGTNTQPLTAVLLSEPLHGKLELRADGSFLYKPGEHFTGADQFVYRAKGSAEQPSDPALGTAANVAPDVAVVKIYVQPTQPSVFANPDKYVARKNTELKVAAPGVLANDYGLANHTIVASVGERPVHGAVTVNSDGSFSYVPETDFVGEDKFTYRASDLGLATSASGAVTTSGSYATVVIHVLAADPATGFIPGGDQRSTDESGPQKVEDWAMLVAINGDRQPKFVATTDKPALFTSPPTIDATGQLTYTPAPNASGTAIVTVALEDPALGSSNTAATFAIHIDKPRPLMNAANPRDVSCDNVVAPNDALLVINHLNRLRSGDPASGDPASGDAASGESAASEYLDVSGDNAVSPLDALLVINFLNANQSAGEGESAAESALAATGEASHLADTIALLAADISAGTQRRRK